MENNNTSGEIGASYQPATQLEFKQAMQDFKAMFPEMDHDVIEEVLRANQGAVDATIDQLLSMMTDNLNEALRLDLEKAEKEKKEESDFPDVTKSTISFGGQSKKWYPPLLGPLPPTFLRVNPPSQKGNADCGEDERIALFLQNEEFLSELRVNPDFMSALDQDVADRIGGGSGGSGGSGSGPDIEAFKERLRNMGKISRNKFAQLSKVFQRRKKNRSAKGILDQSASGDSMLLGAESLLSEGQEDCAAATMVAQNKEKHTK